MMDDKLDYASLDYERTYRCGWPEVIYGAGKTSLQITEIFQRLQQAEEKGEDRPVFATRVDKDKAAEVLHALPGLFYHEQARILYTHMPESFSGYLVVCCAGTSDLPVAEEAALTAELMGARVERIYDVGVAGIHRLLAKEENFRKAKVIVAVAGMEGALASVVGGLTKAPVIAVPTSVGYGASFGGVSALLSMLNSCSSGMAVVNIDNGFGGGYMAAVINAQSK